MQIKELKDLIKDLPDDMEVCGRGHYGEKLDCYDAYPYEIGLGAYADKGKIKAFVIDIEDKGEAPE